LNKIKNILLLFLCGIIFISMIRGEGKETVPIKWMTIEEAQDSMKIKPKKIFIKLYTKWCGVCKMMDRKTLAKERITEPLNKYYYSVLLDAESNGDIRFKDSVFKFNPTLGPGIHNLAFHLGKESETLHYPTIIILDENLEILYKYPSYMSALNLEEVLELYR
jgi:thioredoxin-related protein